MNEGLVLPSFVRAASGFRVALLACLCATALVLSMGCERQIAPPLVEVTELAPREVETGDRLEVHGTGFPQGRTGKVTLEGTVFRPGEPPMRGVSIDVEGTVATPDRLELVVRDALTERFCGRGDRAAHATFRGTVEVSFASNNPEAPPLVGRLRSASLDVLPSSARASVLEAQIAEGGRVLAFLGVVPGAATPRGIPIEQVRPGSMAERTGLQVGDVLVSVEIPESARCGIRARSYAQVGPVHVTVTGPGVVAGVEHRPDSPRPSVEAVRSDYPHESVRTGVRRLHVGEQPVGRHLRVGIGRREPGGVGRRR